MRNKNGGVGARIIIVLILMIASAVGGAYGYRVLDGKMAVREAKKIIEAVRVSDYEEPELTEVQGIIDNAGKDLDTASTRKEVYGIMEDFNEDISKILTKTEKELEAARKEAEEARDKYNNGNNNNNNNNNYNNGNNGDQNNGNGGYDDYYDENSDYDSGNDNGSSSGNNGSSNNNNNSNNNSGNDGGSSGQAITNDDGSSGKGGLLDSLLGGND